MECRLKFDSFGEIYKVHILVT